jgi:hypothetical protein
MTGLARRVESSEERAAAESVSSFMPAGRFQLFELMLCSAGVDRLQRRASSKATLEC